MTNEKVAIEQYLKTYTNIYLKEEIQQEALTRNIEGFHRFLELAAFSNASTVNFQKLAKKIGIADKTVKEYYQILEDTLIAHRIPAFTNSLKKQLQKSPKYYFFDNGVLNTLRGEIKTDLLESSFRYGQLFENMMINEIIKYNILFEHDYKIYHYRTNHGLEIDCILQKNIKSEPMAIEIKSSRNPDAEDVKNLHAISEDYPNAKKIVICRASEAYEEQGIMFLPFTAALKLIFCHNNE